MSSASFSFKKEQFNRLFPFYILVNDDFKIGSMGTSLEMLLKNSFAHSFLENFRVDSPLIASVSFNSLRSICSQSVTLVSKSNDRIILNGQFEYLEDNDQLLFIGQPSINATDQINENNLTTRDDGFSNFTNSQKNELNNAGAGVQDLASFSMYNPNPVLRVQVDGAMLKKNPAAEKLTSFCYKGNNYDEEKFWRLITGSGYPIGEDFSFDVISGEKNYSFTCKYIPGENYFNVYGTETTLQKKNEEELSRLSLIALLNESGVLFTDNKGVIFWVNNGFCKLTGYPANEIIGKKTLDFCKGPLNDDAFLQNIAGLVGKSASFNDELIHYRKDGSWFWGRVKGKSYTIGENQELQYFAVVDDITEEKRQADQIKILSQIAENNINAVIITDKEGKISWINKSFTKMTGYTQEEVLGKKPGHLLQGPKTDPKTIAYLKKQIQNKEPFNTEIYNYSKTGQPYWLRLQGQPIFNSKGDLTNFFSLEEDITEEKEVQERIKRSENQLRLALKKIGDNVWEHNFKTGETLFSQANSELWGYHVDKCTEIEKLWWDNVYKEDLIILKENYLKYQKKKIDSHNLEYRIVHKDGSIKWVLDRGGVIEKDDEGNPVLIIGIHTDISKIKKTETELEQRVKQFKSLADNIPGVIYEYEFLPDGKEGLRYIGPALERVLGIKPEDFNNYLSYIHPDDRDRIINKNQHSRDTLEPFYDESRLLVPGRGLKWHAVHSSFSYITQEGAKVFTGFMMDITERKNIEQTLKANEEKYRSIIENMNLGLLEVDNDESIIYANQSFCAMSGYTMVELERKNASELFLKLKRKSISLLEEKNNIRKKGIADAYELAVTDKNGDEKWWFISGAPHYNDKGEVVGSIGIHIDVTEQKKLEIELIEAKTRAEQLAKTKELFLANMSHEIRTPMNAIMGMSRQLGKTNLQPQQQFYLDVIYSASENLLVIINDILDLSKVEAGKLSFENIGFELKAVVNGVVQVLAHKAEEKGLKLSCSYFDEAIAPVLMGDPYRLNQILINLVGNAIKFTEKGAVDISFTLLKNDTASQVIRGQVMDTGIGIDETFIDHLFDKFSQASQSISSRYGGTGLGMSISKNLIELMEGEIYAESKLGKGTTITFIIELKTGNYTDLPKKDTTLFDIDFLAGKTILITDDNDLNRLVASMILQSYGARVIEAVNGVRAIEAVNENEIDLILMDIQMPLMNGLETTELLRASECSIPIVALTAEAIKGEKEKCIKAGMNDYITKPFKEEEFLKVIDNLLKETGFKTQKTNLKMSNEPLYDLSALKAISRGNNLFIEKMITLFCEQTPPMISEMTSCYHARKLDEMGAIAHKIKPSLDNLNINSLKQIIRDIEANGKNGLDNPDLAEWLKTTEAIVAEVINQMKAEFAK